MKTAVVIINGIRFPYFLTDNAIDWAKKEGAQLNALFLTSGEEMPEEYVFPSDIDLAENVADENDSEKDSARILRSQGKLFKSMIKAKDVQGGVQHLNDASLNQVIEKLKPVDRFFIAPDYGDPELQAVTRFKLQELVDKLPNATAVKE